MISRRSLLAAVGAIFPFVSLRAQRKLPFNIGLQIYSLRYEAEKDLPATLALIHSLGFDEVEVPGFYGRSASEFRRLLDEAGLTPTAMGASYDRLDKDIDAVTKDAQTLGVEYVVCSTIPHKTYLTVEECDRAVVALQRFGKALAKEGLHCCYHTHGTEFPAADEGTVFDRLVQRTDPELVNFEMDIFWIVYAHQDPVQLLHRYPDRFPLMHVKDIRKGTVLGGLPRDVREEDSVPLGQGIVDVPAALRAARQTGVRHFYLEDEAVEATGQIRESLRYLNSVRW
jgi:sugar phosphate isomerase/epimerase